MKTISEKKAVRLLREGKLQIKNDLTIDKINEFLKPLSVTTSLEKAYHYYNPVNGFLNSSTDTPFFMNIEVINLSQIKTKPSKSERLSELEKKYDETLTLCRNMGKEICAFLSEESLKNITVNERSVESGEKEFVLPEKWCVKITEENKYIVDDFMHKNRALYIGYSEHWRAKTVGFYFLMPDYNEGHSSSDALEDGYTEISTEQFKSHVLKQTEAPEEEIDWNEIQYVKFQNSFGYYIVLTDGKHTETDFSGIVAISKLAEEKELKYHSDFSKLCFKPFKGKLTITE